MQKVEDILKLLKEKTLSAEELEIKGKFSREDIDTILNFLEQQRCIEKKNKRYRITEAGLQLLSSPTKTASRSLYNEKTKKKSVKEREEMADRFGIEINDVEHAAWRFAKDLVGVKLRRDLEEKKKKEEEK